MRQLADYSRFFAFNAGRLLAVLLVVYFFGAVLLVATAQQKTVDALEAMKAQASSSGTARAIAIDYNIAIRHYLDRPASTRDEVDRLQRALDEAAELGRAAEADYSRNFEQLEEQTRRLRSALSGLAQVSGCHVEAQFPLERGNEVVETLFACPPPADPEGAAALDEARRVARQWLESSNRLSANQGSYDLAVARTNDIAAQQRELQQRMEIAGFTQPAMANLDLFARLDWPLLRPLLGVPPPLMSIVLAFAAGLFGALLTTVVLFVYPHNDFKFTRSNSFAGRLLLGGLIALGVVVLLFSGVAVLGSGGGQGDDQNMMAYAAIGLLSGMFSDQAAGWLSRASRFEENPRRDRPAVPVAEPALPAPERDE